MSAVFLLNAPKSPFYKLPEDIIRDIVIHLDMKDRARFGATCKRHYDIDIRAGFRQFETIKIAFVANMCQIICKFAGSVLESIRLYKGEQWADNVFLFARNATMAAIDIQVFRGNGRSIDTINSIVSNIFCHDYRLSISVEMQGHRVFFPDINRIRNRSKASFLLKMSAFSSHITQIKQFLCSLPKIKSFSFEISANCEDFVTIFDDSTMARMVEQCEQLSTTFKPLSAERLQAVVQCVQRHPENTVSLWDCPNDGVTVHKFHQQHGFRGTFRGQFYILVHDPSGTIVMIRRGSTRVFIANIPQDKVNDTKFMTKLWGRTLPNHRR